MKISVAHYLFTRLHQLGVRSVHGVPGDFFLKALDHLKPAGLRWVGNCNELNAGYAADGYARIRGLSALFTTFGVGEMSAFNAVAGSYAEYAPVVHIVGTPNRKIQHAKALVHHSLGDGRMGVFMDMFKNVTVAQADLQHAEEAPSQIDFVLQQAVLKKRPVYIALPSDVVPETVAADNLEKPLIVEQPANDSQLEHHMTQVIIEKAQKAQNPLILVDGLSIPFEIADEVNQIVTLTNIPTTCFPFGKGIVDESLPNFYGVQAGPFGRVNNTIYTKNADLVLLFGPLLADNNTSGFSSIPDPKVTFTFNHTTVQTPDGNTHSLHTKPLLQRLINTLESNHQTPPKIYPTLKSPKTWHTTLSPPAPTAPITQDTLYAHLSHSLRPHDVICLANGTPLPGGRDLLLPHPSRILSSSIFLSVGHWLPASQGAALALRDLSSTSSSSNPPSHPTPQPSTNHPSHASAKATPSPPRVILLEGDGSFQSTCQELSTIIRLKLDVTIFLINNAGYTYERLIHGPREEYNDLAAWRYTDAPSFFGAESANNKREDGGGGGGGGGEGGGGGYKVRTWTVRTWGQLDDVLGDADYAEGAGLRLIEVIVGPEDGPGKLALVCGKAGDALES